MGANSGGFSRKILPFGPRLYLARGPRHSDILERYPCDDD